MYFPDRPSAYCSMIMSLIHDRYYVDIPMFIANFWGLSITKAKEVFRRWGMSELVFIGDFTETDKYNLCVAIVTHMHMTVETKFNLGDFERGFDLYKQITLKE